MELQILFIEKYAAFKDSGIIKIKIDNKIGLQICCKLIIFLKLIKNKRIAKNGTIVIPNSNSCTPIEERTLFVTVSLKCKLSGKKNKDFNVE